MLIGLCLHMLLEVISRDFFRSDLPWLFGLY